MRPLVFFDVETPNRTNGQICQIGVIRTSAGGCEEYRQGFYVDPQTFFEDSNIQIHGVSPKHVAGAPTLAVLWERELADVFSGATLVAHNAKGFDLTVLSKDLLRYDYDPISAPYLCTQVMARKWLNLPSCKLDVVAGHYGVPLARHHNALSDAEACAGVFWKMASEFGIPRAKRFVFTGALRKEPSKLELREHSKALAELFAVLSGVAADGVLTPGERAYLESWWAGHRGRILDESFAHDFEAALAGEGPDTCAFERLMGYTAQAVNEYGASRATAYRNLTLGVLDGIRSDRDVTVDEAEALLAYLRERPEVVDNPDFVALVSRLEAALADEVLTRAERDDILVSLDRIVDPLTHLEAQESASEAECSKFDAVTIAGHRFVLTGQFETMPRGQVQEWIVSHGGEVASGVSGKVDYLVVGGLGSTKWAHGTYGGKIKKALDLQHKGKPIRILSESELDFD